MSSSASSSTSSLLGKPHTHNKRFAKPVPSLPLWRRPPKEEETESLGLDEKGDGEWLEEEGKATEWLSLFYDLVVVAVLSVFSSQHEIYAPSVIPVFLSYFVILIWIWTAQVHYDVRYEAEDVFHRFAKLLQIGLLVFIGAASGGWCPGDMLSIDAVMKEDETEDHPIEQDLLHAKAAESFLVIAIAFAVSRVVLAVQYMMVIVAGVRRKRNVGGPIAYLAALLVSCVAAATAASISNSSRTNDGVKIGMLYASVAVEILSTAVQNLINYHPGHELGERYGALSLIIIGEGFINLCRALSRGITKLRVTDNTVYIQAFMVIVVMYNIWSFLFAHFRKSDTIGAVKSAIWEVVHFPLHFSILLLMAALINAIIMQNWVTAANTSLTSFNLVCGQYLPESHAPPLPQWELAKAELLLGRISLSPDIETFLTQLNATKDASSTTATDVVILATQYKGVIVKAVAETAGLEVSESAEELFHELSAADMTMIHDQHERARELEHLSELFYAAFHQTVHEGFKSIVWIYPAAGAVLILSMIRSAIRYHFEGLSHYIIHTLWAVSGITLAMLGFLDVGMPTIHQNRGTGIAEEVKAESHASNVNVLLANNWLIAIVMLIYTFVNVATVVVAKVFKGK